MILTIPKVLAYVTHSSRPGKILVFEQPDFPEAGVQVPAGTVEPGETSEAAVLRETAEETGLQHLGIERFLGKTVYDMSEYKPEIHHRYFFHVVCLQKTVSDNWSQVEQYGTGKGVMFNYYWAKQTGLNAALIAGQGSFLSHLVLKNTGVTE